MGLKKRNKVTAEFNMSSLTDIIFLLLIFFMLTSSLIIPNALNLRLPGESKTPVTVSETPDQVHIQSNGTLVFNGRSMSLNELSSRLREVRNAKGAEAPVVVAPDGRVANQHVVNVLDLLRKLGLSAILHEPAH